MDLSCKSVELQDAQAVKGMGHGSADTTVAVAEVKQVLLNPEQCEKCFSVQLVSSNTLQHQNWDTTEQVVSSCCQGFDA